MNWPEQVELRIGYFEPNESGFTIKVPTLEDIRNALQSMYSMEEQFVILEMPELRSGIRFIQTTRYHSKGIDVELGVEEGGEIQIFKKCCDSYETDRIFEEFFQEGKVSQREEFKLYDWKPLDEG